MSNPGSHYLPSSAALSPNQSIFPLTAQVNDRHHLTIGDCDVVELVEQFGSPLYILDEQTLRTACQQYRDSFHQYYPGDSQVIYACKAWSTMAVVKIVTSEGLGLDVVSGGELLTALTAGVDAKLIYFHGNNKSAAELTMAIEAGCTIIVDNWLEIDLISKIAFQLQTGPVPIMVRLTPGIECHTHEYIRTGTIDSKFGFDPNQIEELFQKLAADPALNCMGLHAHIGSQIFERQPHQDLAVVLVDWLVKAQSYGLTITHLNIGGGLGICYTEQDDPPTIEEWSKAGVEAIAKACGERNLPLPTIMAEPGRSLVGSSCVTAYTVGSSKSIPGVRTYITVDGGMSDNPRPITYQSVYRAVVANHMDQPMDHTVTIAGKHCESGDIVIKDALLAPTQPGDIVVVPATGAYNYSMSSNYNRVPRPAAVLVKDGDANVILVRETNEDLLRSDRLPARLSS